MSECNPDREFGPYPVDILEAYKDELIKAEKKDKKPGGGGAVQNGRLSLMAATIGILIDRGKTTPGYVSRNIGRSVSTAESYLRSIEGACKFQPGRSLPKYARV